jgi:Holliday junction resolvase
MRKRARKDDNHKKIVSSLRAAGCSVLDLSSVGSGCPDLLIGFRGQNVLLEIKTEKGTLTPDQVLFFKAWRGKVFVARTIEEAVAKIWKPIYAGL